MEKALELRRPFDEPLPLDESNLKAISFILEQGPAKVAMHRVEHRSLDESLRPVLALKRLILLKERKC